MEQTPNINSSQMNTGPQPQYQMPQPNSSQEMMPKKKKPHTAFQILIGLAIAVLFVLFYFYSYQLAFEGQKNNPSDYQKASEACYNLQNNQLYVKNQCLSQGGVWNENPDGKASGSILINGQEVQITGRCDLSQKMQECIQKISATNPYSSYGNSNTYENNKYLGALIFGIILIVLSMFIKRVLALSIGLALGGVFMLISGIFHFWADINGLFRVIIIAVGLAIIIFLAVKKLKSD